MLQELVILILATGVTWEFLMYLWPGDFPVRIAPLAVALIALGFTGFYHWSILMAVAAAGGVAIYHKLIGTSERIPPAFSLRLPTRSKPLRSLRSMNRLERSSQ